MAGLVGVALKLGSRVFRGDSARTGGGCTLRHCLHVCRLSNIAHMSAVGAEYAEN